MWPKPCQLRGQFVVHGQQLHTLYLCIRFEKCSFNHLRNIESVAEFRNWVTSSMPRPLRGQFATCEQNCPQSVSMRNLKSVALSATKIWHIFLLRTNWPRDLHLWPFDLESGVRVTCDVGYLCANLSLLRPLCSRLRPDVRDRQRDVRRTSSLNASALWGWGHNNNNNHNHKRISILPYNVCNRFSVSNFYRLQFTANSCLSDVQKCCRNLQLQFSWSLAPTESQQLLTMNEWVRFNIPINTLQVITEMSLSSQSFALILTTNTQNSKRKRTKRNINTHKHTQKWPILCRVGR